VIIIGAGGLGKEILEIFYSTETKRNVALFDNINTSLPEKIYAQFPIIKSFEEAIGFFKENDDYGFTLGIGNPAIRKKLYETFLSIGGKIESVISPKAHIGPFDNHIAAGVNLMIGCVLTHNINVGKGTLINQNATIGHDTNIGKFVEVAPGVNISGYCGIGDLCNIGTNATILPQIKLGRNVIVGAGAVVTKNIPDDSVVVGIPAQKIRNAPIIP
jgi:sugar O-acyltransferase (sialic acid O-acetyltransferase NeuD family)